MTGHIFHSPHISSWSEEGQFYLYNRWRGHAADMLLPEHTRNVVKVKAKVTLPGECYDGIQGNRVTDPFILKVVLCALSGQLHVLAALTLEKKTPVRTA
jgi:hypothetical protein